MSIIGNSILSAVKSTTKDWRAAKRKADKEDRVQARHLEMMRERDTNKKVRRAAFEIMEAAYNKASSNGEYYANARQIMYAARPYILQETQKEKFNDVYFTQTLLKDYIEIWRKYDWKVVWDSRGHFAEPHTGKRFGLGGIDVMGHLEKWHTDIKKEKPEFPTKIDTAGPGNRYKNALFVEKEGFTQVFGDAGIQERFDMALMSTKGLPVKAACDLITRLYHAGVKVFVLRDFDLEGFKIVKTLREGTRMAHGSPVIDLGLRYDDVADLQCEPVYYKQYADPKDYLIYECDATEQEAKTLAGKSVYNGYSGHRVEINAMTSEELIAWLENKFDEHGIQKYVPDGEALEKAYIRASYMQQLEKVVSEAKTIDPKIPENLADIVKKKITKDPLISWDEAVWEITKEKTK